MNRRAMFFRPAPWRATAAAVIPWGAVSAAPIYLEIDGVPGEVGDPGHLDEIAVESFSFGVTNAGSTGAGGGKAVATPFSFTKQLDRASPLLFLRCATGALIDEVTLEVFSDTTSGPALQYRVILSDVRVISVDTQGAADAGRPVEAVSLTYAVIEIEYTRLAADGTPGPTTTATWDFQSLSGS